MQYWHTDESSTESHPAQYWHGNMRNICMAMTSVLEKGRKLAPNSVLSLSPIQYSCGGEDLLSSTSREMSNSYWHATRRLIAGIPEAASASVRGYGRSPGSSIAEVSTRQRVASA
eukprot:377831-Rhodomonas_salina.7